MKVSLPQIAKFFWQDLTSDRAASDNALRRLQLDKSQLQHLLLRGNWEYQFHDQIYGSYWFGHGQNLLVEPGGRAYRFSLATLRWSVFHNEARHPVRIVSQKPKLWEINHADTEPIRLMDVPEEVLTQGMLCYLLRET